LNGGRPENLWGTNPIINRATPKGSVDWVNNKHSILGSHMVGYNEGMPVEKYMSMKIMEDKKSGEKEPRTPERIRNPSIQVIIRLGRRVVCNHRRGIIIIIVVDNLRGRICGVIIRWHFSLFAGWPHGCLRSNHFPNHFDLIPVFPRD
jgi:hypothetical protein